MEENKLIEEATEAVKKNQNAGCYVEGLLAVIHRLQDDYSNLKERYVKVLDLNEKVIAEQKAEIERLTEERDKYQEKWQTSYMNELNLQKRVDELKSENTELYKEHTALIAGSILQKQDIVKDTAKEIYEKAKNKSIPACVNIDENPRKDKFVFLSDLKNIVRDKGVEVE